MHVRVTDADYHGQICAIVSTATPPDTIKGGTQIAQLIPFKSCVPATEQVIHGTQGFGSTGKPQVFWSQRITESRPEMTCTLTMANASPSQIKLIGLLDSGADMTIIVQRNWPSSWPLVVNAEGVLCVGEVSNSFIAAKPVLISNPEGQKATVGHMSPLCHLIYGVEMCWINGGCILPRIFHRGHCAALRGAPNTGTDLVNR